LSFKVEELDFFATDQFGVVKFFTFLSIFVLASILQYKFPHQNSFTAVLKNWRVNLSLAGMNAVLMASICGGCLCALALYIKQQHLGAFDLIGLSYWGQVASTIILFDLVAYVVHRLYHQNKWLWPLHAVHHTDVVFETSTALRFHPVELLISLGVRLAIVWFLGPPILAIVIFEILFAYFNLVEHSDIVFPQGLERVLAPVFITPSMHRRHHSMTERNTPNFGTILSLWDALLGTLSIRVPQEVIMVGTPAIGKRDLNLGSLMVHPFLAWRDMR
jgi:sterol desaturase/sphingolipid hydroxylase (fatty acid hydroxylase superfamily)